MMKFPRLLRNSLLAFAARSVITLLSSTIKIEFVNEEVLRRLKEKGEKIVYIFWHGQQFLTVYFHRNRKIAILTSLSKDGDLQTKILEGFGYKCIRGSSTKGGMHALREMIKTMKEGYDCAFAVDGPRGPVYQAKGGAFYLARLNGAAIVPVACRAEKRKIFEKAWDKYELPLPFSRARIIYGEPIYINRQDDIEQKAAEAGKVLSEMTRKAGF